jgi:uncharacterized protein
MPEAYLRFYGMLNDLLAPELRGGQTLPQTFAASPSVKALVEGFGVPHTEVALVVVNSKRATLSRRVCGGDRIAVYPPFRSIAPELGRLPGPLRFVLDVHLGRLARWIRMLGFDAVWSNDSRDEDLAATAATEERILLTRDHCLLMRNEVVRGYWVRATDPKRQLPEVNERYHLLPHAEPFKRCLECNAVLEAVAKGQVIAPERILTDNDDFRRCPGCRRVFWKGSHFQRMSELIAALRAPSGGNPTAAADIE